MSDGSAPALVLLHGWGFSGAVWKPVIRGLRARGYAGRIHAPDLPGHGAAGGGDELADPDAVAAQLAAGLPDDLESPVWVGWSLGALPALAVPGADARGRILVAGSPRFVRAADWPEAMDPRELDAFARLLGGDTGRLRRQFAALCARGAQEPAALARSLRGGLEAAAARPEALGAGLAALREADRRGDLGAGSPLAALLAQDDALIPPGLERHLAIRVPGARIRRVPGPHALPLAAPDTVAEFIHATLVEIPA